jgi:hypothetical protein
MLRMKSILILFFSIALVSTGVAAVLVQQFQESAFIEEGSNPTDEINAPELQKKSADGKKPFQVRIQKEDAADSEERVVEKKNKSVLKSSSGFVTVFYVLVSYLFSSPFEAQDFTSLQ